MTSRKWIAVLAMLAISFVALNLVAYRHAWRMTHLVPAGERTRSPERLTALGKIAVLFRGVTVPKHSNDSVPRQPYRTVTFPTRDGLRLEAWDIPAESARGTVLLFHGYATGKSVLRREADVFHDLGYRCVLVDFRGSGGSDGMETTLGWCEALDVAAATAWVGEPAVLYGQSMGAAAVLRALAFEDVRPTGIILESPYDRLVHTVGHRYTAMNLPAWPLAPLLVFWGGRQHGFDGCTLNPVAYARAVKCPTLVLAGEHDPWVKLAEARAVAEAMTGNGELVVFEGRGHGAYAWSDDEKYRETISDWLSKHHTARELRGRK